MSPRERRLVALAAAAILAFVAYLMLRGDGGAAETGSSVELTAPPPAVAPPSPPVVAAAPAPPPPVVQAAALSDGLVLHGVSGGAERAAVIGFADGRQRLVPVGRAFLPGLTLKEVGLDHAIVASPSGDLRLELNRPGASPAPVAAAVAAPAAAGEAAQRRETTAFRLALAPRDVGGRVRGYTVRPGANVPALARAGIRPGDVIHSINGSGLDEERLTELSWAIANSDTVEFEIERGGRRMKARIGN